MDDDGTCRILPGLAAEGFKGTVNAPMYLRLARVRRGVSLQELSAAASLNTHILADYERYAFSPEKRDEPLHPALLQMIADVLCFPYSLLSGKVREDYYIL